MIKINLILIFCLKLIQMIHIFSKKSKIELIQIKEGIEVSIFLKQN